jgi:parvulin-like peptidyl-prolyl isomerase
MRSTILVLSSLLALTGCRGPTRESVAEVNGEPISAAEVAASLPLRIDPGQNLDSLRHAVLDAHINKKLFVQEALRQGLEETIQYRLGLEERALVNQELYNSVVESGNRLSELEVQNSYRLLKTEAHLKLLAVKAESTARRIAREFHQGVPFETLAARHSVHPSRRAGGDLGFMPLFYIEEPARSVVLTLKPGQLSEPLPAGDEYQLVLLAETRPNEKPLPPLGEFRQELEFRLKQQRRRDLANQFLADLRGRLEFNSTGLAVLCRPVDSITEAEKEIPVAVKDASKYVKVGRLLHVAARFPPGLDSAMKQYAVRREVEEDLLYEEARERGLDRRPEVVQQLARKRADLLYEALFKKEVVDRLAVSDQAVFDYWRANRDKFPDPDSGLVVGMVRSRLQNEQREARLREYTAELRGRASIRINERLLETLRRDNPTKPRNARK